MLVYHLVAAGLSSEMSADTRLPQTQGSLQMSKSTQPFIFAWLFNGQSHIMNPQDNEEAVVGTTNFFPTALKES